MKINWKVILGIVLTLTVLAVIALPLAWRFVVPNVAYATTGRYGIHMPMTLAPRSGREPVGARRPGASAGVSGHDILAPFGMWFMWLLP